MANSHFTPPPASKTGRDKAVEALIADNGMRKRDERFAGQAKHKAKPDPLYDKTPGGKKAHLFGPQDFHDDDEDKVCICPAGLHPVHLPSLTSITTRVPLAPCQNERVTMAPMPRSGLPSANPMTP